MKDFVSNASPKRNGLSSADYSVFEAMPGNSILLQPDAPHFTILAVTEGMIQRSGLSKAQLVNKPFFVPFPANPGNPTDPNAEGQNITLASFEYVIKNKQPHQLPLVRYDLEGEAGLFTELYWRVNHKPVLNNEGDVIYIIHTSEDVTEQVRSETKDEKIKSMELVNNLFMQAPFAIHILTGPDLIIDLANKPTLDLWGREDDVRGKRFLDVLPELEGLGYDTLMHEVMHSGKSRFLYEVFLPLKRPGKEEGYFNFIYHPYYKEGNAKASSVLIIAYEVTEQVQARKRVEESETHLELLRNTVPAMIFYLDAEQRYRSYNETFMDWFGVDAKEVIGKSVREFLGEEAYKKTSPHLAIAYSGRQERYEMFAPSKMSEGRWLSIVYTPHKTEEGKVKGVIVLATDITHIKQAELALQQSEQNLRNTILQAPVAMCIFRGPDHVVEIANERMFEFWGRGSEDVLGKPIFEGMPEVKNQGYEDLLHNVFTKGERFSAQGIPVTLPRNGKVETAYINLLYEALREGDGTITGVIAVAIDVTEQVLARQKIEESEQDLRSMILAAPVGICLIDAETLVSEIVNESFIEVAGKPYEGIVGKMYWDTFAEVRAYYEQALQGVIETGEPYYANEVELMLIRHGKKEMIYVTFVYLPLTSSRGKVKKVVIYVLENTPQVLARQKIEDVVADRTKELAEANRELQRSNQNLEEFAHAASHDLKEPIRKIRFFTHQLKEQLITRLEETELRAFNRIENATERMGNLIDDLLLYSHVSQRPVEMEAVDLGEKIKAALEDLELDVEEKKAVIHVGKLPVVKGYRRQLQQVFQNLLSNALKYSKAGTPPRIDISAETVVESGQAYHVIAVKDNGIGFEQQYADKIFHMFSRLHGRSEYSGTGVGLSIVKKVVDNHKGLIRVESKPEQGSTFKIYLPVEQGI
jgi:hypothetical protein